MRLLRLLSTTFRTAVGDVIRDSAYSSSRDKLYRDVKVTALDFYLGSSHPGVFPAMSRVTRGLDLVRSQRPANLSE